MSMPITPHLRPRPVASRAMLLLAVLALAAAWAKISLVVLADPMIGYANNFDFIRSSTCTGIWQARGGERLYEPNPQAPINQLIVAGYRDPGGCMRSIDNLFPMATRIVHRAGSLIDYREISVLRLAALAAMLALFWRAIPAAGGRLLLASAFAVAVADFAMLAYYNTLYVDFSVIAGCFFSLVACVMAVGQSQAPSRRFVLLAVAALCWLGLAKQQYGPLASVLALYLGAVLWLRWRQWRSAAALTVLALALPLAFSAMNNEKRGLMRDIVLANKADTFLGAVLPASRDPAAALAQLGLPASCRSAIGIDWYTPDFKTRNPCPEYETLSRAQLPLLFVSDPATFLEPMHQGLMRVKSYMPPYAFLENPAAIHSALVQTAQATSLSHYIDLLPNEEHARAATWLIVSGLVAGAVSLLLCVGRPRAGPGLRACTAGFGLGGGVVLYSIASSVFGDGYMDMQKHAICFLTGLGFQLVALAAAVVLALRRLALGRAGHAAIIEGHAPATHSAALHR